MSAGLDAALTGRRAALLDLDGTLVDSEPANQAAYRSYFAARGWDVGPDVLRAFAGRRGAEVFAQLAGPWSGEDAAALVADVVARVDLQAHPPRPVPGAAELIRRLHAAGVAVALVTSAGLEWAERAVGDILGVRDLFAAFVTAETTSAASPTPRPTSPAPPPSASTPSTPSRWRTPFPACARPSPPASVSSSVSPPAPRPPSSSTAARSGSSPDRRSCCGPDHAVWPASGRVPVGTDSGGGREPC